MFILPKQSKQSKQWILIRLRKEIDMTQTDVATYLGLSKQTYYRKENGLDSFIDIEMFKLKELFGKEMDQIFLPPDSIKNRIGELGEDE